jgi:hypothetical protein
VKLIENWKHVLLKAWSVRWIVIANVLGAAPLAVDGLADAMSPRAYASIVLLANIAALVSRFIKQDNIPAEKSGA